MARVESCGDAPGATKPGLGRAERPGADHGWQVDHPPTIPLPQRAPSRGESSPRRTRRLPRTWRRRTHQLALPNMRRRCLWATPEHSLHGAGRACGRADLERPRTGRRARRGAGTAAPSGPEWADARLTDSRQKEPPPRGIGRGLCHEFLTRTSRGRFPTPEPSARHPWALGVACRSRPTRPCRHRFRRCRPA
jgi:hypothetical protein